VGQSWAVSADGARIAYMDERTGDLHTVRADGQSDHVIAALGRQCGPAAAGCAVGDATRIVWSPDGAQLAYVTPAGAITLVNSDGTNPRAISAAGQTVIGSPLWSADALRIAYVTASAAGQPGQQSLWVYDLVAKQQRQLTAPGDGVSIAQLAWVADPLHPALTWAATQGASITGVFTVSALGDTGPLRLTPTGSRYGAAAFSPRPDGGMWALASQTTGTLATVSATGAGFVQSASAGAVVASVAWAPAGRTVAIVTVNGDLSLWTPGGALTPALAGVSGAVAWAPDGSHLSARTSGGLAVVTVGASGPGAVTTLAQPRGDAVLLWAPDGKSLAVSSASVLAIASADGTQVKLADAAAGNGPLAWTVAG
jgi:Tol biopolymer transport system component